MESSILPQISICIINLQWSNIIYKKQLLFAKQSLNSFDLLIMTFVSDMFYVRRSTATVYFSVGRCNNCEQPCCKVNKDGGEEDQS